MLSVVMLSFSYAWCHSVTYKPFMMSVIILNVVMLNIVMLNVFTLSAIMLSIRAPIAHCKCKIMSS
jgi:hypothetical protein